MCPTVASGQRHLKSRAPEYVSNEEVTFVGILKPSFDQVAYALSLVNRVVGKHAFLTFVAFLKPRVLQGGSCYREDSLSGVANGFCETVPEHGVASHLAVGVVAKVYALIVGVGGV